MEELRWRYRFGNYSKSFLLLLKYAGEELNELERAGVIQLFEVTIELGWKLLKDYLEEEGFTPKSPRDAIKDAFSTELIDDGECWLRALRDRNL